MTDRPAVQPITAAPTVTASTVAPHAVTITGTPDRPDFKRRPALMLICIVMYAAFMALLIVWALRLRHSH